VLKNVKIEMPVEFAGANGFCSCAQVRVPKSELPASLAFAKSGSPARHAFHSGKTCAARTRDCSLALWRALGSNARNSRPQKLPA
jgi:hypothetical protein